MLGLETRAGLSRIQITDVFSYISNLSGGLSGEDSGEALKIIALLSPSGAALITKFSADQEVLFRKV